MYNKIKDNKKSYSRPSTDDRQTHSWNRTILLNEKRGEQSIGTRHSKPQQLDL